MNNTIQNIDEDIKWRIGEIAMIKAIISTLSFSDEKKKISMKYSIPSLYAVWEGFVINTFSEYIKYINQLEIKYLDLNTNIVIYDSFTTLNLTEPPKTTFDAKKRFIKKIHHYFNHQIKLSLNIKTNSNVNYATLTSLCHCYGLQTINNDYEAPLNKFVGIRNKVAHGDNSIVVNIEMIEEFANLINDLMEELRDYIQDAIENKRYLENPLNISMDF